MSSGVDTRGRIKVFLAEVQDLSLGLKEIMKKSYFGTGSEIWFEGFLSYVWPNVYKMLINEAWLQIPDREAVYGGKTIVFQGVPGIGKTHSIAEMLSHLVATGGKDYAGYKWSKVLYCAPTHRLIDKVANLIHRMHTRYSLPVYKPLLKYSSPAKCRLRSKLVRKAMKLTGDPGAFCRHCIYQQCEELLGDYKSKQVKLTGNTFADYVLIVGDRVVELAKKYRWPVVESEIKTKLAQFCTRRIASAIIGWLWSRDSKKSAVARRIGAKFLGVLMPFHVLVTPTVLYRWLTGERKDSPWLMILDEADTFLLRGPQITLDLDLARPTDLDVEVISKFTDADSFVKRIREALREFDREARGTKIPPWRAVLRFIDSLGQTLGEIPINKLVLRLAEEAYRKEQPTNYYILLKALNTILSDPFLRERRALLSTDGQRLYYYSPLLAMELLFNTEIPTMSTTKLLVSATFLTELALYEFGMSQPGLLSAGRRKDKFYSVVGVAEYRYKGLHVIYHNYYDVGASLSSGELIGLTTASAGGNAPGGVQDLLGPIPYDSIHTSLLVNTPTAVLALVYYSALKSISRGGSGNVLLWVNSKRDAEIAELTLSRVGNGLCVSERATKDYRIFDCKLSETKHFKLVVSWFRSRISRGLDPGKEGYSVSIVLGFANPRMTQLLLPTIAKYSSSVEALQAAFRVARSPELPGHVLCIPKRLAYEVGPRSHPYDFRFIFESTEDVYVHQMLKWFIDMYGNQVVETLTDTERLILRLFMNM